VTIRLHHTGISTPNLDRLVTFYCELLGFEEVSRSTWERGFEDADSVLGLVDTAAEMVLLRLGDTHLEVFEFRHPAPGPAPVDRPVSDSGINHICLSVNDVASEYERLTIAGMQFHSTPRDIGDGPFAYGRDPDGNVVELWEARQ
jgi:catechol 2,3-dioxygenase-like lactoylglutathione lyase family enzyme